MLDSDTQPACRLRLRPPPPPPHITSQKHDIASHERGFLAPPIPRRCRRRLIIVAAVMADCRRPLCPTHPSIGPSTAPPLQRLPSPPVSILPLSPPLALACPTHCPSPFLLAVWLFVAPLPLPPRRRLRPPRRRLLLASHLLQDVRLQALALRCTCSTVLGEQNGGSRYGWILS